MGFLSKILLLAEPEWMAKKDKMAHRLEFYLMECLRRAMSLHFGGIAPCVGTDLSRMITMLQFALGMIGIK